MNFPFSCDNYYLMGAIALALLLVLIGAYIYISGRESPAEQAAPIEEGPTDAPPPDHEHAHEHEHAE